uniref:Uncharacterized protein n=1 Tax=Desertifilum tharense IPPAS B-1220 TaxID=1781255 RepID=A0ACD5GQQ9_9CYAN
MKTRRKQLLVYVALDDPEVPSQGAYLVAIAFGGEDSPASREQAKFELERRFEEELPPSTAIPLLFPMAYPLSKILFISQRILLWQEKPEHLTPLSI